MEAEDSDGFKFDPIGWIADAFAPVINVMTFNLKMFQMLGDIGILIRALMGIIVAIGVIELIWIG